MANIEEKGTPGRETAGAEVPSSTPQPSELHTWTPKTALMSQKSHFGSENGLPPSPSFPRTVDLLGLGGGAAGTDGEATDGASNASMEVRACSYVGRVENYAAFVWSFAIMAKIQEKGIPDREPKFQGLLRSPPSCILGR